MQVHLAPGSKFDFQKYIKRSLEDDFKVIVGISPPLWASALIFLFLNVNVNGELLDPSSVYIHLVLGSYSSIMHFPLAPILNNP